MIFILLTFLAALALAAVSGWFSIVGFMAIYAGAPMYALIMGIVVECAKLVTTSWLYRNSSTASWKLKVPLYYFTIALMAATSIGVFGFLSKAHLEQGAGTIDNGPKIERLNYQIEREKSIIADNEKVIKQLDDTVNSFLGKERTDRSLAVRKSQAPQRKQLREDIDASQKRIDELSEEKLKLDSEVRKMQLEVGPIRYIAELVYGVQEDSGKNVEAAVRLFTLLIVSTLDPLAIALLIAANHSLSQWKKRDEVEDKIPLSEGSPGDAMAEEILSGEEHEVYFDRGTGKADSTFAPSKEEESITHETPETREEVAVVEVPADAESGVRDVLQGPTEMVEEIQGSDAENAAPEVVLVEEPHAEEEQDTTHTDTPSSGEIQQDWISTLALVPKEEILALVVEEPAPGEPSTGLEGEVSDREAEEEGIIEVLKPSWETNPGPIETKPWAHQDAVLRELLGQHFTPQKVNEKEENKAHTERGSSDQDRSATPDSEVQESVEASAATEVPQVSSKASIQDQVIQVLSGSYIQEFETKGLSEANDDKYPKALSWLKEFRRD